MLKKNEWDLILRHLAGESSDEEKKQIELWLASDLSNREHFEKIKNIWDCSLKKEEWNTETEWLRLHNAISSLDNKDAEPSHQIFHLPQVPKTEYGKAKIPAVVYQALRVAAVLLIMVGGYFILQQTGIFNGKTEIAWNEKTTVPGEKFILTLNDNSKITLNADSKLKYPVRFNSNSREIYLEGEAYFEVAHDSSKPFIVHSGNISTTVLGTKFNVSAFSGEKNIAVSLVEGKVKVSKEEPGNIVREIVMLHPNQQLLFNTEKEIIEVEEFDLQTATGWKDNILKFNSEPLENVFVKLERTYGIKFELAEKSFSKFKITGNFHNESFWTVSEALKKLTGLKYKSIKENNITKKIVFYKK